MLRAREIGRKGEKGRAGGHVSSAFRAEKGVASVNCTAVAALMSPTSVLSRVLPGILHKAHGKGQVTVGKYAAKCA
jgi:hypothetical protein